MKTITKKLHIKKLLFSLLLFMMTIHAFSQTVITGKITDSNTGEAIPGANIIIKGTTQGTISDIDGNYSIQANQGDVLEFSYVGYLSQSVEISNQTIIDISLEEDIAKLDEVVVIGYGTRSKRFVSGSISSVDMEETKSIVPNTNVAQSLGQIAGIQFINNGRPGQGGELLIRGQNSLGTDTDPLIVLDGIIFEGSLSDINPQDIASIDVLKDAASTAIYGSRAANGVIMITSVKGKTTKPVIRFNSTLGLSEAAYWMPMQSKEGYIQRRADYYTQLDSLTSSSSGIDTKDISQLLDAEEYENYKKGIYKDGFKDLVGQQGKLTTYDLSISGRTDQMNYLFSASMSNDVGLIKGDQESRTSVRVNLNTNITNWLTIGTASFFSFRDQSGQEANLKNAYQNSPFGTFYDSTGHINFNPVSSLASSKNALYEYELTDNMETRKNLFSNLYANIDIPFIKGLSYRVNYSPNYEWHNNYSFMRQDTALADNNTVGTKDNSNIFRWVWENIVTYEKSIGVHDFDITLMYGRNSYSKEETNIEIEDFEIDILGYNNLSLGNTDELELETPAEEKFGVSSLARLNYMFRKKYLVSVAIRKDGSSVFGKENKFGYFPSVALSWIASEEPFMKNINAISFLKIRASYGTNGNEAIKPYKTQTLNMIEYNVLGDGSSGNLAIVPYFDKESDKTDIYMGNISLRWESTSSTNIGIDFGVLDSRINGSIDVYDKTTKDQIVARSIPSTTGKDKILDNIGEVNNRGIEFSLNTMNVQNSKFQWNTSFTFAFNKNEIVHLFGDIDGDGIEDDAPENGWFLGENINAYYDYEFDGIYQVSDTGSNPRFYAGDIMLKDNVKNDTINEEDRAIVGHGKHPDYTFTFNNTLCYGNFSLFISINSMLGWVAPFDLVYSLDKGQPFNSLDAGYWTPENKSETRPSLIYSNGSFNNHFYVSRNFVRIKDVALSYDFNKLNAPVFSKFESLRLSISIKNLYTFTKWLGPDPENAKDIKSHKGSEDLYPMPKIYSLGINISF